MKPVVCLLGALIVTTAIGSVLNLRMQACRAGRLNLRGDRNSRHCEHKRRSRQSSEFSHQILRLWNGKGGIGRRSPYKW
jgi:hypothetical protein